MEIEKINTAIEFLKDGLSFTLGDLRLGVERNTIKVTGWSQFSILENLTKHQAIIELEEIKSIFNRMIVASPELRIYLEEKIIEYNLFYDDYGKGSITICSETNGTLTWDMEL